MQSPANVTDPPGVEFLEFLDLQRAYYRRGLAEKCARMTNLWRLIAAGDGDAVAVRELERQAHGMARSAATFGLDDLGAVAGTLELAVHRILECHGSQTASQRLEIDAAMRAVHYCVRFRATAGEGTC